MSDTEQAKRPTQAVILAGGKGARLKGLSSKLPKPLIEIAGRTVLDHVRQSLADVGVERVLIVVSHFAEQIEAHLKNHPVLHQESLTVWQPVPQGTGQAVKLAVPELGPGPMWIIYSDVILAPSGYERMIEQFTSGLYDVMLGVVNTDDPCNRASVFLNDNEFVENVVARPGKGECMTGWGSTGIYIAQQSLVPHVEQLVPSARGEYELSTAINQLIEAGGEVKAHLFEESWADIVEPKDIVLAEDLLSVGKS